MVFKKMIFSILTGVVLASSSFAIDANSIRVRIDGDPTTLDWNKQLDVHSERVSYQMMEGLVRLAPDGNTKPALAESWTVSKDRLTYRFKIRNNVQWSDGQPLIAQHFVDAIIRLLDPKTAANGASLVYEIKGAAEFHQGKSADAKSVGVAVEGERVFRVDFKQPSDYFLAAFDHPITYPIRMDVIAKFGDKWTMPENIVTLGPYQLVEWRVGQHVKMKANPKYYGEKPKFQSIEFLTITDSLTALNLYEKNEIDLVTGLPVMELPRISKMAGYKSFDYVYNNYLGFNVSKAPFDNVKVRKAFAHAINKEALVSVLGGGKKVSHSWIPSGVPNYNPKIGLKFDEKMAKKYLAEAGFPDGKGFPNTTFYINASDDNRIMAEAIQSMIKQTLNIQLQLEIEPWKAYLSRIRGADQPALFRMGQSTVYNDPHSFMVSFSTGHQMNNVKYSNKDYDALVAKAAMMDPKQLAKRQNEYDKAQKMLVEDETRFVPLFHSGLPVLTSPKLKDLKMNARSMFRLSEVKIQ